MDDSAKNHAKFLMLSYLMAVWLLSGIAADDSNNPATKQP